MAGGWARRRALLLACCGARSDERQAGQHCVSQAVRQPCSGCRSPCHAMRQRHPLDHPPPIPSFAVQGNYTLMITALGFLQVLLLLRQMEACSTPALASRVSLLTLAHQVGAHPLPVDQAGCWQAGGGRVAAG